jgi:hypothetical protein
MMEGWNDGISSMVLGDWKLEIGVSTRHISFQVAA